LNAQGFWIQTETVGFARLTFPSPIDNALSSKKELYHKVVKPYDGAFWTSVTSCSAKKDLHRFLEVVRLEIEESCAKRMGFKTQYSDKLNVSHPRHLSRHQTPSHIRRFKQCKHRASFLPIGNDTATKQSSKVSGFVYLALSTAEIAPDSLVKLLSARADRLPKNRVIAAASY
jgi:hypothetical protein